MMGSNPQSQQLQMLPCRTCMAVHAIWGLELDPNRALLAGAPPATIPQLAPAPAR